MPPACLWTALLPSAGERFASPTAARHVRVLRLQPGDAIVLFDGSGPEWSATITAMGRQASRSSWRPKPRAAELTDRATGRGDAGQ